MDLRLESDEEWRAIPGWPLYEASSAGRVRSWAVRGLEGVRARKPHVLTPSADQYARVRMGANRREGIHVLVALAFIGPREPGWQCRHLNGDPTDNRLTNLAWGTRLDNEADKRRHGRNLIGERHHQARLTESDVLEIRGSSETATALAMRFRVSETAIYRIRRGERWRHV